jgi:hypothetical protein
MSLSAPQIVPLTAPGLEVSVASGSQRSSVKLGPSSRAVFHVNRKQFQEFVYSGLFYHIGSPAFGSLVYSVVFAAVCWVPAAAVSPAHVHRNLARSAFGPLGCLRQSKSAIELRAGKEFTNDEAYSVSSLPLCGK